MSKTYCIFSAQYLPHMGGIERYTSFVAKGLIERGERVLVVTTNPGKLPDYERMDGVPVLRLPALPLLEGRFPVPKLNRRFFRLHQKLKAISPDIVLVNARFYFHSLYGILWGRGHKALTLVLDHGSSHLSIHQPLFDLLGSWFEHSLTALEKIFCQEFYGVSKASVAWLSHFHIQAKGILPNAVDLSAIEERLAHPNLRVRDIYQIPQDATVLVYTGRLLREKGLLPLKKAFDLLCEQRDDIYLLIAGDGPLYQKLKRSDNDRMILTGRLSADEIIDLLGASDIFCLPSASEGFSTSLLEAVACKNHVLVTKNACPFELLKDESYASIIENPSPALICKALNRAVEQEDYRCSSARKAYDELKAHLTWDKTLNLLQKISNAKEDGHLAETKEHEEQYQ